MIPQAGIQTADAGALAPLLKHLLGVTTPAEPLAKQCISAIADLPENTKPTTYDSFVDVARFCVEEEPGWSQEEKESLVACHKRCSGDDEATTSRLDTLNEEYERLFPGLRFVTYDVNRPAKMIAAELESIIGRANTLTREQEVDRALEMMWDAAVDRATRLENAPPELVTAATVGQTRDDVTGPSVPVENTEDVLSISSHKLKPTESSPLSDQDEPFLPLSAFRALAVASPVLCHFFEHDLTNSFRFEPVHRSTTGGAFAWHAAPVTSRGTQSRPEAKSAPLVSLFGGGNLLDEHTPASYSRDVTSGTRGKVMGFLGGLLGEEGKTRMDALADQVAMRLQTHSVTGPRPSFAKETRTTEAPKQRPWGSSILRATGGKTQQPETTASESTEESPVPELQDKANMRDSDYSQEGTEAALATLRAANEGLVQERTTFVIDEVQETGAEEEDDTERADALMDDELGDLEEERQA